jgi:hypothetical protein
MTPSSRHLRLIGPTRPPVCRAAGCGLPRQAQLGYCASCDAVYRAARVLQDRLLELRAARMQAAPPDLFAHISPPLRADMLVDATARDAERAWPAHALDRNGVFDALHAVRELAFTHPKDGA